MKGFIFFVITVSVTVHSWPTALEIPVLEPPKDSNVTKSSEPAVDKELDSIVSDLSGTLTTVENMKSVPKVLDIPILRPGQRSEVMDEDLDAIVVVAGEATTLQPQDLKQFDPSDCFLPKERGPCRALLDSYFFNTATKACEIFAWSGCGGNANRFATKYACDQNCKQPASPDTETNATTHDRLPESQKSDLVSPSSKPKPKLPVCPKFSGCGPSCVIIQDRSDRGCKKCLCGDVPDSQVPNRNDNLPVPIIVSSGNVTISKTSEVSVGSVSGIPKDSEEDVPILGNASENCKLPTKRGHCRGMMTRFHYDPTLKDCVLFHYGGCDGNLNNFVSKEKCLQYCKGQ